jgi:hypothetical protein
VLDLSSDFLYKRKKQFKVKPYILFVFDEAQEFVADLSNARGIEKEYSIAVETLLRQEENMVLEDVLRHKELPT